MKTKVSNGNGEWWKENNTEWCKKKRLTEIQVLTKDLTWEKESNAVS